MKITNDKMILRVGVVFVALFAIVNTKSVNNYENAKHEVEEYILNKKKEINLQYKLHYHVTPPVGWMNDPNGFSHVNGEYHLFYQFYPYDSVWGPMHWGHVASPDLVHWKQLPTALIPEDEQCFSGSAFSYDDKMVLMYTGRRVSEEDPYFNETQYLAFSDDGINFYKYDGNPVLSMTPNNAADFRDPKVWQHGDYYYVILGSKTDDERGRVLLYRSKDVINWEFLSVLGESKGDLGYMWECPDFFELDGKFVLLMSPQGVEPEGDRYKNIYQTGYIIGDFDYETFEFKPEVEFQELDFGHDYYAASTTENDGRRYVIAWFNTWEIVHPEAEDGWAGAMTIVREMKLVNNRILMTPVADMVSLREEPGTQKELQPNENMQFGKTVEIIVDADLNQKIELQLDGVEGGGQVWLRWDPEVGKVVVDRGSDDIRQVEWEPLGSHSWRIFLDASSLELFCGEGEVVFSSRVYPLGGWKLRNLSPQTVNITAYNLQTSAPL
ncbi:sucrose-6-phosphate hydrolase-like [Aricia agestis]|uniref:sucrose-6-phosphate hydrolase-like n=1 Tax=Aricia agestis TaxID=91739 RepID=UPI001C20ABE4|nr:sucrose-6-phosphate hydrolase-like [Aricia agestis]